MRAYEYRHIVGLEETNLVGNVYYVNHLRWQGRIREMFLREYVPGIISDFEHGFALVTVRCSCDYLQEVSAFDRILIRMLLGGITPNQFSMNFEYWREDGAPEALVAKGEQRVACMRRENGKMTAVPIPVQLRQALEAYGQA